MTFNPPSLAEQIGTLRTATLAADAHGWLPAALHALIMACLARLFGSLEQMILLWQAGQLPAQAHHPRARHTSPASRATPAIRAAQPQWHPRAPIPCEAPREAANAAPRPAATIPPHAACPGAVRALESSPSPPISSASSPRHAREPPLQ